MGGWRDVVHTSSLPRLKAGWEEFLQGHTEGVWPLATQSVVLRPTALVPLGSYWKYNSSLAEEKHRNGY